MQQWQRSQAFFAPASLVWRRSWWISAHRGYEEGSGRYSCLRSVSRPCHHQQLADTDQQRIFQMRHTRSHSDVNVMLSCDLKLFEGLVTCMHSVGRCTSCGISLTALTGSETHERDRLLPRDCHRRGGQSDEITAGQGAALGTHLGMCLAVAYA